MAASTRVLRLLTLLQARREWTGAELSERLEVDVRTIRRDAARLRELGYVVDSSKGPGGGYRLAAGAHTPPLLLDDEEALTVAIALRAIAGSGNYTDAALRVLVKLDQLLPKHLKRKWDALKNVTLSLAGDLAVVDSTLLASLAAACRDARCVSFRYAARNREQTTRNVEPMRLVHTGRVWYLVAWDREREDWRTFRLDRIESRFGLRVGSRFAPREPPEDFATYVSRSISSSPYRYRARLLLPLPIADARKRVPAWVGVLEPRGAGRSLLTVGANSWEAVVSVIVHTGVAFELIEPVELVEPTREIAQRLLYAVRRTSKVSHPH